ncbi:type II toxin-antitoxin system RelE/ParE family toxin [Pseudomonas sp. RW1P2]|uniref:Type II toxin-antitoxin system RelE/ParE family toxin n=2 Tax=Pseudomonas TaxID=286 RepID=A0ACC5UQ37_9PSED|nr:type II toxin-antitoxin system RelE/ParE family toxin [Pseudomonas monteilii]MBV4516517.1 type II toxin-antitoxin system RelE/ParE family toxin [Pseudomonas kurunegalensis]
MMEIFKRKDFARLQAAQRLDDELLCQAVDEMQRGLVDANLGGALYKKRVAAQGMGKRGGYRTLLSARIGNRCVFLHGFAKSDKANITLEEQNALRFAGKVLLNLSPLELCRALRAGVLMEICCEQQAG